MGSPLESGKIIGVGRAVYDHSLLLDHYPDEDEKTVSIDRFHGSGSPVPNALSLLARWGHDTLLVAVIGDDSTGSLFMEDLRQLKVSSEYVITREQEVTPCAYIRVNRTNGSRSVVLDRTIAPLTVDELPSNVLRQSQVLLIDGWETDAAIQAATTVREASGKVMLDAGDIRPRMEELLSVTDWLIVPLAFAQNYQRNANLFELAQHLRNQGPELAIITNGTGGCVASWLDQTKWFPAFSVPTVDSTGAGDCFHAGMIHGLLNQWDIPDCIRWASAAAAINTTALGGRGKLASIEEVEALLAENR